MSTESPEAVPAVVRAEPIHSRFLFVDVAARRAIQLKRGALARLQKDDPEHAPRKLERIAMQEVREGLIQYEVPPLPGS
jgi:DNA-directed RNA polymerase subunit K/omega